jgi:hypothetical protein
MATKKAVKKPVKKTAKASTRKVIKSAADGRFKSKEYAKKHPKTTFMETVKVGKPKKAAPKKSKPKSN